MTWDDARLTYWQRLVHVRRERFYRLIMRDLPGWQAALVLYHEAEDRYLTFLRELA